MTLQNFENTGIYNKFSKDSVIRINDKDILGDTPAKKMSKLHQLCGGSVISESGETIFLDRSKIDYINEKFQNKKIAVYYKFIGERTLLEKCLQRQITGDVSEFRESGDKVFVSQYQSGREGISLATADYLIFYNMDYSYLSYEQTRNRVTNMNRETQPEVIFLVSDLGLDEKILRMVRRKKQFTIRHFMKGI
jgi:hypothetical protein